jgi:hypothetical protein
MKVPSTELSTFMLWMSESRFARLIMNTHRRLPRHRHDVDSGEMFADFLLSVFVMKNVNAANRNKKSKNRPIDQDEKVFRMW